MSAGCNKLISRKIWKEGPFLLIPDPVCPVTVKPLKVSHAYADVRYDVVGYATRKRMDRILVAAAALNQTPLSWEGNLANIREAILQARAAGAQVLCLPELCVTGYGCEDAFHSAGVVDTALVYATKIARETRGIVVAFGLPLLVSGTVYNVAALAAIMRPRAMSRV